MRFVTLIVMLCFGLLLKSQTYNSRDNYTGDWQVDTTWNFLWANPTNIVNSTNLNIYGHVSLHDNLTVSGAECTITVHDTLVIYGDLSLGNNIHLRVRGNGLLVIRGNLIVVNNTDIFTNGYVIVTGDFINTSNIYGGFFWTVENPSKVFFGGTVPDIPEEEKYEYFVLDCEGDYLNRYLHSGCAYGNEEDLEEDPIFDFFNSTCAKIITGSNSPLCEGEKLLLTATGGSQYQWTGPSGFSSILQNPEIDNINSSGAGTYLVQASSPGCINRDTLHITVKLRPALTVTLTTPVCEGQTISLSATGAEEYHWTGPDSFTSTLPSPSITQAKSSMQWHYFVKGITEGCADTARVSLIVTPYPEANAGEDIILEDENQTVLHANTTGYERGEWTILSGSGIFSDIASPVSSLSELPEGESRLKWTTFNGTCTAYDEMLVKVIPLFIPNVITPNSDGKNDYLVISALGENAELIVFNRLGITVYSSKNYMNGWNGVDDSGNDLPDDTYYYVIKTGKGLTRKGSILIKRR